MSLYWLCEVFVCCLFKKTRWFVFLWKLLFSRKISTSLIILFLKIMFWSWNLTETNEKDNQPRNTQHLIQSWVQMELPVCFKFVARLIFSDFLTFVIRGREFRHISFVSLVIGKICHFRNEYKIMIVN